eukprot:s164_g68.t1
MDIAAGPAQSNETGLLTLTPLSAIRDQLQDQRTLPTKPNEEAVPFKVANVVTLAGARSRLAVACTCAATSSASRLTVSKVGGSQISKSDPLLMDFTTLQSAASTNPSLASATSLGGKDGTGSSKTLLATAAALLLVQQLRWLQPPLLLLLLLQQLVCLVLWVASSVAVLREPRA